MTSCIVTAVSIRCNSTERILVKNRRYRSLTPITLPVIIPRPYLTQLTDVQVGYD